MALHKVLQPWRHVAGVLSRTVITSQTDETISTSNAQVAETRSHQRPKIPHRSNYRREACKQRQNWVEVFSESKLHETKEFWKDASLDPTLLKGNIEMPIGMAKIPLAVAGPLLFTGTNAVGYNLLPMALTEGTVVASTTRGAALMSEAGGVTTHAGQQQMTRDSLFITKHPQEAIVLGEWIEKNTRRIQEEVVDNVSSVAKIKAILPVYDQEAAHCLFTYTTGDAAGQNATTVCTWAAMDWIRKNSAIEIPESDLTIQYAWIEGQMAGDKKPCMLSSVIGRGMSVSARCEIPEDLLNDILNIDSSTYLAWYKWTTQIMARAGLPANVNISNTLAASFAATGQDIACVAESSMGQFSMEPNPDMAKDGIIASMHIPSLVVGTVGGGTELPTQAECLGIMGCVGAGKVQKFAEIIAGFCLALDLSTGAAVACGEFASAHDRHGRNRPNGK